MSKGYWIGHLSVTDPEGFKAYGAAAAEPLQRYGARFLVRGGRYAVCRGAEWPRHFVIEFDSFAKAQACHDSPEYQAAAKIRDANATIDLVIVEGVES